MTQAARPRSALNNRSAITVVQDDDTLEPEHLQMAAQLYEMIVAPSGLVRGTATLHLSADLASLDTAPRPPRRSHLRIHRRKSFANSASGNEHAARVASPTPPRRCTLSVPLTSSGNLTIQAVHRDPAVAIKQVFARAQRELQRRLGGTRARSTPHLELN
jgi:hypothetical protein